MNEKIIDLKDRSDELSGCETGTTKLVEKILKNREPIISEIKNEGKKAKIPDYNKGKRFFDGFTEDGDFEKETDEIIKENYPEKLEKPIEPKKSEKTVKIGGNVLEFKRPK